MRCELDGFPRWSTRAVPPLVALSLLASAGCKDNGGTTPSAPLTLTCSASPTSGVAPLSVALDLSVAGGDPSFSLQINYGDGTSGSNANAVHVYSTSGVFTLSVSLGNREQSASCSQTITVAAPPPVPPNGPPFGGFYVKPNPPSGPAPLAVEFNMCNFGDPDNDRLEFSYVFGDGTTFSGFCRATHKYKVAGSFAAKVCLTDGYPGHQRCNNYTVSVR